ncbi:kinetochore protein SPC25 homolog isoform X2 [Magnolia sinica]|uniref:kinetochore protein SPC25 homolog isoform X2 n=1 Tax=Magnolia sinica TaxID=86752 RepID=UPI002658AE77|nr:kinetochore protein SPC25 homolog isoform X2 [Magnolia sinica]
MQRGKEQSIHRRMVDLRLICDREIQIHQQRAVSATDSFRKSLQSIKLCSEENAPNQAKLGKLKDHLRQLEDEFVKSLAVKTRKEAGRIATSESLSAAKARTEELKKIVQDQRSRRDEYSAIISQQLLELEKQNNQDINHLEDLEKAISWYNSVLGFRIEAGKGVKFIFNKIDMENPNKEYSFTIRHENDTYTLLNCEPYNEDTKGLMRELNQTNGLFKFVRMMRERFLVTASKGTVHRPTTPQPESPTLTMSVPTSIFSSSRSESVTKQNECLTESQAELDRPLKKVNHGGRGRKPATSSPKSASSLRRSPRLKGRK